MIVGKILPSKLRYAYYYWKSKHLVWKRATWCDCGVGFTPADLNVIGNPDFPQEREVWYWNKINIICPNCDTNSKQYHVCWEERAGVYCSYCRWTYNTDFIGEYPRGKKYKGESYSN